MTRVRGSSWAYERSVDLTVGLIMGPIADDGLTYEMLETGWRVEGEGLMEDCRTNPNPAWRPWGWWAFELCESAPGDELEEARRLAEIGELRDDEVASLRERAAGSERWARVWQEVERGIALGTVQTSSACGTSMCSAGRRGDQTCYSSSDSE